MLPVPPSPPVPKIELSARLAAIRREMAKDGVEFLILTDQKNFEYITDYKTLTWAYQSRPLFLIVSAEHLLLIASKTEARNVEEQPRVFEPVYYTGYMAEAAAVIISEIATRDPSAKSTTAIDYGQDMLGRGALAIIEGLRERGLKARVVSGVDLLWRVRIIKTPFEADLKRTSFKIVNAAFDEVISEVSLGITEVELCRKIQARIFLNGAERADPIAMVFGQGDFIYSRLPRVRALQAGQYIWTDFRSTYGGYPADRNRIARAGAPKDWEVEAYEKVRTLTITLANSIKAGVTCGDIYQTFEQLWGDASLPPVYGMVSRIGHGGGLDVTEPPSLSKNNPEQIKAGMILHLEPKLELDGAVFQFEEVIYVRDDGIEFLSELSPEQIPVIN